METYNAFNEHTAHTEIIIEIMGYTTDRIYLIDEAGNIIHSVILGAKYTLPKFVHWVKTNRSSLILYKDIILDMEGVNSSHMKFESYQFSHTMKGETTSEHFLQHFYVKINKNGK